MFLASCGLLFSQDVRDFVTHTGEPNYLIARVPVTPALNIYKWRELLQNHEDIVVCDFLEFGRPFGLMPTNLPNFDLRTHRGALLRPEQVTTYLAKEFLLAV